MKNITLLFLFLIGITRIYAQSDQQLETLVSKIDTYAERNIQEKVYLHLDKPFYSAGEDIWLKAYLSVGIENFLSGLSNIMYVELLDPSGDKVMDITLPVTAGIAYGDLPLSDTLTEGTYRLRAYTQWMLNFDPDYLYDQMLPISNGRSDNTQILTTVSTDADKKQNANYIISLQTLNGLPIMDTRVDYEIIYKGNSSKKGRIKSDENGQIQIPIKKEDNEGFIELNFKSNEGRTVRKIVGLQKAKEENNVEFFAEGGYLLRNVESKIAFKATNSIGKGIHTKLTIVDEQGNTIAYTESDSLGMGSFVARMSLDTEYIAKAEFEDGIKAEYELPEIEQEGISMMINPYSNTQVVGKVNLQGKYESYKTMTVILQSNGTIYSLSKININSPEFIFRIPKENIPSGVLQLSLLDEDLNPLAERFIFNFNPDNILNIDYQTDKQQYTTREKVHVEIEAISKSMDRIANSTLSATVLNLSKLPELQYSNLKGILPGLLLSPDVKGYIEKPDSYFNDLDNIDQIGIDHLLLTQAWRKLEWKELDNPKTPVLRPQKSMEIKGTTHKLGRKAVEPNAHISLISTHNFMDFIDTTSNTEGKFTFDKLVFPDSIKFLISAKTAKGKNNIDIKMEEVEKPAATKNKNNPEQDNQVNKTYGVALRNSQKYQKELENQGLKEKTILIEEVVINKRIVKKASPNSSNLNGSGNADYILTSEDLETCTTLAMCLQGRVPGIIFQNGVPYSTRSMQGPPMQVVLDGMYIEATELEMINPSDVASVEVLRNVNYTSIYGSYGGGGLLIITSKTGLDARRNYTPKGLITYSPKGYYISRKFYNPKYDLSQTDNTQDLRTTIHWEPMILTNEKGKASFEFYSSDEKGTYLIQIQGMDWKGNIGSKIFTIEVN